MGPQVLATSSGTAPGAVPPDDVPVVLAGIHGHGRSHLDNLDRLARLGSALRLAGICDPLPPTGTLRRRLGATPYGCDLATVIDQVGARITILATPIHTHADLALTAASHGSHLLLEKPPTATLESFVRLRDDLAGLGVICQVGFQSLGSRAIAHVQGLVADGAIGTVIGIGAACAWTRDSSYWARARWAGRRSLDGEPVVDGVLTNPFAHAIITALRLDGSDGESPPSDIEVELYRANDIEADDTSCVRLRTATGTPVLVAATLCAEQSRDPFVAVHGTQGSVRLFYKRGEVRLRRNGDHADQPSSTHHHVWTFGSEDLLENLHHHVVSQDSPLLAPLAATASFMHVVEAVRTAPEPVPIPTAMLVEVPSGEYSRRVVPGVNAAVQQAASEMALFSELGLDWARAAGVDLPARGQGGDPVSRHGGTDGVTEASLATLQLADSVVAEYLAGTGLEPTLSPRPFLHPVRTLAGTVVTDAMPADHRWHLGLGVAIADVGGINLWGGRTYLRDVGYAWLDDHGWVQQHALLQRSPSGFTAELSWLAPGGRALLHELREMAAEPVSADVLAGAWRLRFRFTLRNVTGSPLSLGSPGSNGRRGGGYGGFFWRLPPFSQVEVGTPDAVGEAAVHGRPAPWLAVYGRVRAERREVALVFRGADERTRQDAWFVRLQGYPGVGSSLAAERPVVLAPGESLTRSFEVLVADGAPEPARLAAVVDRC